MPKVFRTLDNNTSVIEIPTRPVGGELEISITENVGTDAARTVTFGIPVTIAETLIKALYTGMKLDDPSEQRPTFKFEP